MRVCCCGGEDGEVAEDERGRAEVKKVVYLSVGVVGVFKKRIGIGEEGIVVP